MYKYIRTISVLLLAAAIVTASHAGRFAGASGWVPISVGRDAAADDLRAFAAVEPIDSHVHAFQSDPGFTAMISGLRLHGLDITVADTQGIYGNLDTELARAKSFVQGSDGHASLCVTFDPFRFREKDFAGNFPVGGVGEKIGKISGWN